VIWVLYGEEEFLRMARRKALLDELLKDLPRDFALQTLRGKAFTPARLTEFYEMAFGSPYKVIVLLEGESLGKAELKALATYFQHPSPTNHLIIEFHQEEAPSLPKREGIHYEKFSRLPARKVAAWLEEQAKAMQLKLPPESVSFLVEAVGTDLRLLYQTLQTLALSEIVLTPTQIAEALGLHPQYNVYRLVDVLAEKNYPLAWEIFVYMAEDTRSFPVASILWSLQQFYQRLMVLYAIAGKGSKLTQEAIQQKLGLRYAFQARPYQIAFGRYTLREVQEALRVLYETDARMKGLVGARSGESALMLHLATSLLRRELPAL
jgi:DNA polymerase III delta subunit